MKCVDDYINGNLTDARNAARRKSWVAIFDAIHNDYHKTTEEARAIANYLKGAGSFQDACDAEGQGQARPALKAPEFGNPNCDGAGPHYPGQVRLLPTGGDGNAILCRNCFQKEMRYRLERNKELSERSQFEIPAWEDPQTLLLAVRWVNQNQK